MPRLVFTAVLFVFVLAVPASAQEYPVSGEIYLSFEENRRVTTRDVQPGEQFQLWIRVDIPASPGTPELGITGVEGGIALPPELRLIEAAFPPAAINLGIGFREPGLETFIVGLGECRPVRPVSSVGYLTLELVADGHDIEIGVTAPAVQAAGLSSFAGIGPGWASRDCREGGPIELVLFAETPGGGSGVVLNATAVPTGIRAFSHLKSRYR